MSKDKNEFNEFDEPIDKKTGDDLLPIFFDDNKEQNIEDASKKTADNEPVKQQQEMTTRINKIDNSIKVLKTTQKAVGFSLKTVGFVLKKTLSIVALVFITMLVIGIITGMVVGAVFFKYIMSLDNTVDFVNIEFELDQSTSIFYIDSRGNAIELENEKLHGSENRTWASFDTMPQNLHNAFIAVEDKRFRQHNGVDYKRSLGAFANFFIPINNKAGGGSTITQQLIKNITKEDDVKIQRKVQEMLRAMNLEKQYDKNEILEMYLNTIYLSQNCYGIKTAAKTYFGKELSELSLVECAALAAIPKSPTFYDPIRNPGNNLDRRRVVLKLMYEQDLINLEQYNEAYKVEELTFAKKEEKSTDKIHSYYIDALIEQVIADLMNEFGYSREIASKVLYSGGLKIYTSMDPFVQQTMEEVFTKTDHKFLSKASGILPQSSMVVLNPENGSVLGIIGGLGEKTANRSLNRATQSKRQCGSSIKPLTAYAPAVDRGLISYGAVLDDTPYETYTAKNSPTGKTRAWPGNAAGGFRGLVTMNYALNKSLNTIPVKLVDMVGIDNSFNFLKNELGFTSIVERVVTQNGDVLSDKGLAPLALGGFTYGVTTMEMAAGYTMLANRGIYSAPRLYSQIKNNQDIIIITKDEEKRVVIKESTAFVVTKMLQNAIYDGTGRYVSLGRAGSKTPMVEVAGKTGSTNDDRDRYFVGYTPYYVGACWFGYDTNKTLSAFTLAATGTTNPALTLWDYVMIKLHQKIEAENGSVFKTFHKPSNIVEARYCIDSGDLPSEACKHDPRGSNRTEVGYFERGTEPTEECRTHILVWWDSRNKAVASASTPEGDLKKIALLDIPERSFQVRVFVIDAQYVYHPVPSDYQFPTKSNVPYFQNLVPSGVYVGETYPESGKHPVNSFSYKTYKKDEMPDATWFVVKKDTPEPIESEPEVSEPEVSVPENSGGEFEISIPPESKAAESETTIIIID